MRYPSHRSLLCSREAFRQARIARECGEADRPDARAMFLAQDSIRGAQEREARIRNKRREAQQAERTRAAQEQQLDLLKDQQAKALARGELTPERVGEFRAAREVLTASPPRRPRRRSFENLASPNLLP